MKKYKHNMKMENNKKHFIIMMILTIINIILFLASGLMLYFTVHNINSQSNNKPKETTAITSSSQNSSKIKKKVDATSSQQSTEATSKQENKKVKSSKTVFSDELQNLLKSAELSEDNVNNSNSKQLVTVSSDANGNSTATISFFELIDNKWVKNEKLTCNGFVGAEGTVSNMSEDISGTPKGFYSIGEAFYRNNIPETKLDMFEITENTYWVDDPNSKYYNKRVEGTENQDWTSAEHMIDINEYEYGFVIQYNTSAEYNKGSAIFFHIGNGPTGGCVSTSEDMVKNYLSVLDKSKNPYILII